MYKVYLCAITDELGVFKENVKWEGPALEWLIETVKPVVRDNPPINVIIGGRNTMEDLPFEVVDGNYPIVLSRGAHVNRWVLDYVIEGSLDAALTYCAGDSDVGQVFIIGGLGLLTEALSLPEKYKILEYQAL